MTFVSHVYFSSLCTRHRHRYQKVSRNSIWREHCTKEQAGRRLNTNFAITNPLKMPTLPDKPNYVKPLSQSTYTHEAGYTTHTHTHTHTDMHTGTALGRNRTLDDIERLTLLQYSIHERPNGKQCGCLFGIYLTSPRFVAHSAHRAAFRRPRPSLLPSLRHSPSPSISPLPLLPVSS